MSKPKINFGTSLVILFILLIGLSVWLSRNAKTDKLTRESKMTSRETALLCTTDMATEYHIHPELKIVINGVESLPPPGLGIGATCMTSIHTHKSDGVIHVESPIKKDFVLGDFFAVWNKDFSKDKILDSIVSTSTEILVTVNGDRVDTYENTILRDKDKIVISYKNK